MRRTPRAPALAMPTTLALVAHDHRKAELLDWAEEHRDLLAGCALIATGTTGKLLAERLDLPVTRLLSGPIGGDLQLGGLIAEEKIDGLIFFWDPLQAQPHDPDVRALLRVAVVWNVPAACNRATADLLVTSSLVTDSRFTREIPTFQAHNDRDVESGR